MAERDVKGMVATADVPSNIALVKYWGKRDVASQWPANDSLSMTLSVARTVTTAVAHDGPLDELQRDGRVYSNADRATDKGIRHLELLRRDLRYPRRLLVETHNTFPTGCGIASSASGLGALTLAALAAWTGASSLAELAAFGFPRERLAHLARLGSGSACRSLYGGFVLWEAGATPEEQRTLPLPETTPAGPDAPPPWTLADIIVVVSPEAKAVSSTAGHQTAWSSPLFAPRLAGLPAKLARVRAALARRDLEALGLELEAEALEMHGVMLSSSPPAAYLTEGTVRMLAWLRRTRQQEGLPAYFTLDAGPNVHVLCEHQHAGWVANRIRTEFPAWELIMDATGAGPTLTRRQNP